MWGVANDIIKGYSDGSFRPNQNISRAQMAAIMYRYMANVENYSFGKISSVCFSDAGQIDSAYREAVDAIVSAGIMSGTASGTFEPNGTANRGMAATVMLRMYKLLH